MTTILVVVKTRSSHVIMSIIVVFAGQMSRINPVFFFLSVTALENLAHATPVFHYCQDL